MSDPMNLEGQIIYKLGGLESLFSTGMSRIDSQMESLKSNLTEFKTNVSADIAKLEVRLDHADTRISNLENWKSVVVAKVSVACLVVLAGWAVFGGLIEQLIQRVL